MEEVCHSKVKQHYFSSTPKKKKKINVSKWFANTILTNKDANISKKGAEVSKFFLRILPANNLLTLQTFLGVRLDAFLSSFIV